MDLWIKNQDRDYLTPNPKLKLDNIECSIIESDTDEVLGIYESEERALEVFNEMQRFIEHASKDMLNLYIMPRW